MAADTWAIVLATFAGPIAAVIVSMWREDRRQLQQLRFNIFRLLMATRRLAISQGHVEAVNTIEVAFHRVEPVENAHRELIAHLNTRVRDDAPPAEHTQWETRRQDLLALLLAKMAAFLKITKGEIDIRNGGYAPQGWAYRDERDGELKDLALDIVKGKRLFPIIASIVPLPPQTQEAAPQSSARPPAALPPG